MHTYRVCWWGIVPEIFMVDSSPFELSELPWYSVDFSGLESEWRLRPNSAVVMGWCTCSDNTTPTSHHPEMPCPLCAVHTGSFRDSSRLLQLSGQEPEQKGTDSVTAREYKQFQEHKLFFTSRSQKFEAEIEAHPQRPQREGASRPEALRFTATRTTTKSKHVNVFVVDCTHT